MVISSLSLVLILTSYFPLGRYVFSQVVAICSYLLVVFIKAKLNSPYSITEVATLISVSALEKADLKKLLTAPSDLLESNQNVKEPKFC